MANNWIFKSLTSKSINAGEIGFASVQPNYPNIFNWTTDNQVAYDTHISGPLIITFSKPILISKYRILTKKGLRYPKGWSISVSYDENNFMIIDTKNEDGIVDCGELTDRKFSVPTMTIRKIKIILTTPNSCSTYDLHICAFDIFGTTEINKHCSFNRQRKYISHILFFITILNK